MTQTQTLPFGKPVDQVSSARWDDDHYEQYYKNDSAGLHKEKSKMGAVVLLDFGADHQSILVFDGYDKQMGEYQAGINPDNPEEYETKLSSILKDADVATNFYYPVTKGVTHQVTAAEFAQIACLKSKFLLFGTNGDQPSQFYARLDGRTLSFLVGLREQTAELLRLGASSGLEVCTFGPHFPGLNEHGGSYEQSFDLMRENYYGEMNSVSFCVHETQNPLFIHRADWKFYNGSISPDQMIQSQGGIRLVIEADARQFRFKMNGLMSDGLESEWVSFDIIEEYFEDYCAQTPRSAFLSIEADNAVSAAQRRANNSELSELRYTVRLPELCRLAVRMGRGVGYSFGEEVVLEAAVYDRHGVKLHEYAFDHSSDRKLIMKIQNYFRNKTRQVPL